MLCDGGGTPSGTPSLAVSVSDLCMCSALCSDTVADSLQDLLIEILNHVPYVSRQRTFLKRKKNQKQMNTRNLVDDSRMFIKFNF